MAEAFVGFFIIAVAAIWVFIGLRKLVQAVDRARPRRDDWVAEHKRRIALNGIRARDGGR
jgi:hypothetical protein